MGMSCQWFWRTKFQLNEIQLRSSCLPKGPLIGASPVWDATCNPQPHTATCWSRGRDLGATTIGSTWIQGGILDASYMCQGRSTPIISIGDGHQPKSVGVYIPIKRIPIKGGIWWDDHPQYSDSWPWHTCRQWHDCTKASLSFDKHVHSLKQICFSFWLTCFDMVFWTPAKLYTYIYTNSTMKKRNP